MGKGNSRVGGTGDGVSHSERDELLTGASDGRMPKRRRRKRFKWLKRTALGLLVLVLLIGVGGWFFGPKILSNYAPGIIASQSRKQIEGGVDVDRATFSWNGRQEFSHIKLLDPSGGVVADLNASLDRGLIALATNPNNLGTVRLDGQINIVRLDDDTTNLQNAIEPRDKPATPTPGQPQPPKPSSPGAIADLIAGAELSGVSVSYKASPTAEPVIVTIDGVATLDQGDVAVDLTGVTSLPDAEPIKITLTGKDVLDALGNLQLDKSQVQGALEFAVGDEGFVDLMRRVQPERDWPSAIAQANPTGAQADAEGLRAEIRFVIEDGALGVDENTPAYVRGRLVPAIIRAYAGDAAPTITTAPRATLAITQLALALPDFSTGAMPDMRGGSIKGYLEVTEARGSVDVAGETESITVRPMRATFGTEDFADGLGLVGSTSWERNGQPAGDISFNASVTGVLDDKTGQWTAWVKQPDGKPGEPDDMRAQIIADDLPTSIIQAFVTDARIVLREIVGPECDIELVASLEPGASASSDKGRATLITLSASGEHARVTASAMAQTDRIASSADGVRAELDRVTPALRAYLGEQAQLSGDGSLRLAIPAFELPMSKGVIDWEIASAKIDLHVGDFAIIAPGQPDPIQVSDVHTAIALSRGGVGRADLDSQMSHRGQTFGPSGAITVRKMFSDNPATKGLNLSGAEFTGQISTGSLPTGLAAIFLDAQQADAAREALGETAALSIRASGASATTKGELATIELTGDNGTTITIPWSASETAWAFGPTDGSIVVTPGLVTQADAMFDISGKVHDAAGTDPANRTPIRLGSPFTAKLAAQPIRIALDERGLPLMETDPIEGGESIKIIGLRQASLSVPNTISLSGLPNPVKTPAGAPGAPIALQVRGLEAGYSTHPNAPRDTEMSVRASIFDPANTSAPVAQIDAAIRENEIPVEVRLINADAAGLERIIGRPGMIDGALGSPISLTALGERPKERPQEFATLTIDAPRLKTGPITVARSADNRRIDLVRPVQITWSPTRAWFDQYALKGGDQDWRVRLVGDFTLPVAIDRLSLGGTDNLFDPGIFALSARAEIPSLTLATREGQQETIRNLKAGLSTTDTPGTISLKLTADDAQRAQIVSSDLTIADLLTSEGGVDTEAAQVTGWIKGQVPTVLVDTAMGQKGLLVDTLGPTSMADVTITDVSMTADRGSIAGDLRSNNASVQLSGPIENAVFKINNDARAEMGVITDAASRRLLSALFPFLNSFEKTAQDRPAVVTATGLQVPLDGDMRKLNGTVNIDLGTVKFKTDPKLAPLLKAIKARQAGEIGQKVPPFVANITNGVIRYEEVVLPIGDVTMKTYGKVNLVSRKIELIIMVPFAAVSDDLAATVGRLPFVGDIAVVPLKVVGDLGQPRVEFDPELLIKNTLEKNPIGSILEQLGNDRKDDKKKDDKKKDENKPNN